MTALASPRLFLPSGALLGALPSGGCDRPTAAGPEAPTAALVATAAPALAPLVTVPPPGGPLALWAFAADNFAGVPVDPVNLIFTGRSDPRSIRAALLRLNGDRTALGFPGAFPFDCTWSDAIGDVEAAFAVPAGWLAGAVQLACGPYGPLRFHLRCSFRPAAPSAAAS